MAGAVVVFAFVLSTVVPTLVCVLVARGIGLGVPEVQFGVWGPRVRQPIGASILTVTPWLFSSSYTLKDFPNREVHADASGASFHELNPMLRAAVVVAGPLSMLLACMLPMGVGALASFVAGFSQIVAGAISPFGSAQTLLAGFWGLASTQPWDALALLLTKFAAFNLLPLPSLPGGNALVQLIRWRRPDYPAGLGSVLFIGLMVTALIGLSWAAGAAWFILSGTGK